MASNDTWNIKTRAARVGLKLNFLAEKINQTGVPCVKQTLSRALHNEVKTERDNDICQAADRILAAMEKAQGGT